MVSRRKFLTSGSLAGVGGAIAIAQLDANAAQVTQTAEIRWNREVDVVVVGAGASGLPAAIAARDGGASVLLVEQHFDIGGSAIISGGAIHIGGGNRLQLRKGIKDSPDLVFADWTNQEDRGTRFNDRELVRKFADENVPTFEFLTANGLDWEEDYVSGPQEASSVPRQIRPREWPVRSQLVAFDQNRNGSGIVRALERSARQKGVDILLSHKMTGLVKEGENSSGRIIGLTLVQVDRDFKPLNRTVNVRARKGVILCTGGHRHGVEFRRMFDPRLTEEYQGHSWALVRREADGERLAMALGAAIWGTANQTANGGAYNKGRIATRDNYVRGILTPESPVFFRARASGLTVADWQDVILVKENGKRFYNELDSSADGYFAAAMAWTGDPNRLNGGGPIWAIFDSDAAKREGWSTEPPAVDKEGGYFFSGDTLEELASQITRNPYQWRPMPGAALRETVARFNEYVDSGEDKEFNRPSPPHKIEKPPFHAAWATPCLHDSDTGLRTNTKCQVLDTQGHVMAGLYCAGESQGGFSQHGLGRCIVFGRIAGMEAAKG